MQVFSNSDPRHAKINPLRARRDKPHLWFQDGLWRVSPMPIERRREGRKELWHRAHNAAHVAHYKLAIAAGATHLRWCQV